MDDAFLLPQLACGALQLRLVFADAGPFDPSTQTVDNSVGKPLGPTSKTAGLFAPRLDASFLGDDFLLKIKGLHECEACMTAVLRVCASNGAAVEFHRRAGCGVWRD